MSERIVSRYGVYRDLEKSPYRYESPYGDIFKFPSQKKLDIYTREIQKELDQVDKLLNRLHLREHIPSEIINLLYRSTHKALYRKAVR